MKKAWMGLNLSRRENDMGMFDKNSFGRQIYFPGGGHRNSVPDLIDTFGMLFTDVETEGKKQGYARAAAEYEKAFSAIENEYKYTKYLIRSSRNMQEKQSNALLQKLQSLEQRKRDLEKQLEQKMGSVSKKYDIPVSDIRSSLRGSSCMPVPGPPNIFDLVYKYKIRKLQNAEQQGYLEAKELYEAKIEGLKKDLELLKEKGNAEIQELIDMSNDILEAIANEQMKIAELNLLL